VKVDTALSCRLPDVPARIRELEEMGFDSAITTETGHDPFLPLLLAAEHSTRIGVMTSIAVAFARSPMTTAMTAHDLNAFSRGRFVLGLGSQIKPHITKRFSMPWSHPAPRMREFLQALRAIWASWYAGEALSFRGEFYTHTLMTPTFAPEDTDFGAPKVALAAVGPLMTQVAGEVADAVIAHGFTTRDYMTQVTVPALEQGLALAGRARRDVELIYPAFVVTGDDLDSTERAKVAVCKQIAFYGSTPAYRPVLEIHGWGELQDRLNAMSKRGEWDAMGELIADDVLHTFAVVGEPDEVVRELRRRFGGIVDRLALSVPHVGRATLERMVRALRAPVAEI
jgi:probable F420-dependent oxidoreductase